MHLILILFLLHTTTKMTELTPWEALKNGRGTRGVRKSWAEERSRGGKLTKAAAEQRAAGDNNHYNETVVSLLKSIVHRKFPFSMYVHRRQSSLSAPALIRESFHVLLWNASFPQLETWSKWELGKQGHIMKSREKWRSSNSKRGVLE